MTLTSPISLILPPILPILTGLVKVLHNNLTEKAEEKDTTYEAKNFNRPYVPVTQRGEDHRIQRPVRRRRKTGTSRIAIFGVWIFGEWKSLEWILVGVIFVRPIIRGLDLSQCNLKGASIHGTHISGTLFPKELSAQEILLSHQQGTRMRYET